MSDIAEERMQNAIDELEQENRLLRARNDRLEKEISELQENGCKYPLCQNEEYQQGLAEQIKRELYTGQPAQQKLVPYEPSIDMQEHGSIASGYDLSQARVKKVYQAMIDMHDVMMEREPTDEWFRLQSGYPEQPAPMIRGDIREGLVGGQPTQEQIIAGAKALGNRVAETCNIDQSDQWKFYSEELIEDSRVVLTAAFNVV